MLQLGLWLKSLKGAAVGLGIAVLLLLLCSGAAVKMPDPDFWVPVFTHGARVLGGLLCGFFAARFHGEGGIFPGLAGGILYVLLLLTGALCMGGIPSFGKAMLLCAVCLAASLLGSLLGKPRERSTGSRHRDMMKRMKRQTGN